MAISVDSPSESQDLRHKAGYTFPHHAGHGIGLSHPENPYFVRHATETPKPLQYFNTAIPDGLQQILNYMIAKAPAQRYPSPERAAQALRMFLMADSPAYSAQTRLVPMF